MDIVLLALAAILLVVPFVLAVVLLRRRHKTKMDWLVAAVTALAFGVYALLVGCWDLFSYYLRPLLAVVLVVAVVVSFIRVRRSAWFARPANAGGWVSFTAGVLVAALFTAIAGFAISGTRAPAGTVALSFPLRTGVAVDGQGGGELPAELPQHQPDAGLRPRHPGVERCRVARLGNRPGPARALRGLEPRGRRSVHRDRGGVPRRPARPGPANDGHQ